MLRSIDGISRYVLVLGAAVTVFTQPADAQPARGVPAAELGQIVDEVFAALLAPERHLSRVSVANRGIYLDYTRTLAAFGLVGAPLRLSRTVPHGADSLLQGCSVVGRSACERLGWGAYVWLEPVQIGDSTAVVRLTAQWPDRGDTPYQPGIVVKDNALLVGYSSEVHLRRDAAGRWRFVKRGRTKVG